MWRKWVAFLFLTGVAGVLMKVFWITEVKFLLPTPVPENYREVYTTDFVFLGDTARMALERPVFYHFFTTSCSCSRFNLRHFNELKRKYGDRLDFVVVLPSDDDIDKARPYFEGETHIVRDEHQQYAIATGVYSTPQAVIIDTDHHLYFRGNYNKARYCTDPQSNFAQMAIDSLLRDAQSPDFGPLATIAYGCGIEFFPGLNE